MNHTRQTQNTILEKNKIVILKENKNKKEELFEAKCKICEINPSQIS